MTDDDDLEMRPITETDINRIRVLLFAVDQWEIDPAQPFWLTLEEVVDFRASDANVDARRLGHSDDSVTGSALVAQELQHAHYVLEVVSRALQRGELEWSVEIPIDLEPPQRACLTEFCPHPASRGYCDSCSISRLGGTSE